MQIKLLHHSPLWLASNAIRMSHDNHLLSDTKRGNIGSKDKTLIERVGNKLKHKSVLEQLVYWFEIDGISRGCLQELARHRTARLTVKSTRYTLKELKDADVYNIDNDYLGVDFNRLCVTIGEPSNEVNIINAKQLFDIQGLLKENISNDKLKYMLPEAFKTKLQWQIDGRNLQNFLELRTSKDAHWEIRELAYKIYEALPYDHKYLYEPYLYTKQFNTKDI